MTDSWGAHPGGLGYRGIPPPHPQRSPSTVSDPGSTGPPLDIKPAIQAAALAGYSGEYCISLLLSGFYKVLKSFNQSYI